jgi:hypothetical protein
MKKINFNLIIMLFIATCNIKAQSIDSNTKNTIRWDATLLKTNGIHFVDQQEGVKYYIQVKENEVTGAYAIDQDGKRYDGTFIENKEKQAPKEKKKKPKHETPVTIEICTVHNGVKTCKVLF